MSNLGGNKRTLRVLVVDDSAVVRQVMSQLLTRDHRISVVTSSDPIFALEKIAIARPDVIITDLEMPRMDGITFVRRVMRQDPIPIILCSGNTEAGAGRGIDALMEGAIEIITKPKVGVRDFLQDSAEKLLRLVWEVAGTRLRRSSSQTTGRRPAGPAGFPGSRPRLDPNLVAVGASTGGTDALRQILEAMPLDCPGLVIVQHMPPVFTRAFARHLDRDCAIFVKEAEDGDRVTPGCALIAPGNRHLVVQNLGHSYVVRLEDGPPVNHHRPSVDVLFNSVAQAAGSGALGILLTGMGKDGASGLLELRHAGCRTIAQDEESCVVFGMPAEAIALGAAQEILPLGHISRSILNVR